MMSLSIGWFKTFSSLFIGKYSFGGGDFTIGEVRRFVERLANVESMVQHKIDDCSWIGRGAERFGDQCPNCELFEIVFMGEVVVKTGSNAVSCGFSCTGTWKITARLFELARLARRSRSRSIACFAFDRIVSTISVPLQEMCGQIEWSVLRPWVAETRLWLPTDGNATDNERRRRQQQQRNLCRLAPLAHLRDFDCKRSSIVLWEWQWWVHAPVWGQ